VLDVAGNVTIENNTIIAGSAYALFLSGTCSAVKLKNNIVLANGAGRYCIYKYSSASFAESDYNLLLATNGAGIGYFDAWASDLPEWQTISGLDTHSISLDPLFKDQPSFDYHLRPNSPAIDAGDPTSDYSLERPPNGGRIDLGAYGGTPEATGKLTTDLDNDGDVDGSDLSHLAINPTIMALAIFTPDFGTMNNW
jgi:hypothetical protein